MQETVLYDYWRSSASYRVRIALNLKNVVYRIEPTSLLAGEHRTPEYLAKNPQGFVPMLAIDGLELTQSLAIIDYLDANFPDPPMVSPDPATRAKTLALSLAIAADTHPLHNLRVTKFLKEQMGRDEAAIAAWTRHWQTEGLKVLEAHAPETGSFGGDAPNMTDVVLVPQMYSARRFEVPLDGFPMLVRIDAALCALSAFQAAHPERVKPPE